MAKVLRISGGLLWLVFEIVLFLIIFLLLAIRSFTFQTWLAERFARHLEKELGVEVRIDRVEIIFFDQARVAGLYIEDQHGDTLVYAGETRAELEDYILDPLNLHLAEATLDRGVCKLIKYEGEEDLNIQFLVDYFASEDTTKKPFEMTVDHVGLTNMAFVFQDQNERQQMASYAMDYSNLDLRGINLDVDDLHIVNADVDARINQLTARDRSGFSLEGLSGQASYSKEGVTVDDMRLEAMDTRLKADRFALQTPNGWSDFTNEVILVGQGLDGQVQLGDLGHFTDALYGGDELVQFNGSINGPVNELKLMDLAVDLGQETRLAVSGTLPQWDEIETSNFDLDIQGFHTTKQDLASFRIPPYSEGKYLELPEVVADGDYDLTGTVRGNTKALLMDVDVATPLGRVNTRGDFSLGVDPASGEYVYNGSFVASDVALGTITGMEDLGQVDASLTVSGTSFDPATMRVTSSGTITGLGYKGYTYDMIRLEDALYRDGYISGGYTIEDPNARVAFNGEIGFKGTPVYKGRLDIDYFNPVALNLMDSDSSFSMSGYVVLDASGKDADNVFGRVLADDFVLNYGSSTIELDSMEFLAEGDEMYKEYTLTSSLLDARFSGLISVGDLGATFKEELSKVFPSIFPLYDAGETKPEDFDYELVLKEVGPLINIFSPVQVGIAPGTKLTGTYQSIAHKFSGELEFDYVEYGDVRVDTGSIVYVLENSTLSVDMEADHGARGDQKFKQVTLSTYSRHDDVSISLSWADAGPLAYGSVIVDAHIDSLDHITMDLDQSLFAVKTQDGVEEFEMSQDAKIEWLDGELLISNLRISHQDAYVLVEGVLGPDPDDKLHVEIHDTPMELLWAFTGSHPGVSGFIEGEGDVYSAMSDVGMDIKLEIKDMEADQYAIGDFDLEVIYSPLDGRMNVSTGKLTRGGEELFSIGGYVTPKSQEMNLTFRFNNTDLAFLNGLVQDDAISNISGSLNNELRLSGTFEQPDLTGSLNLNDVSFRTGILGAPIRLDGDLNASMDMIDGELDMYDAEGTPAKLFLTLYHRNLSKWNLGVELHMYKEYVGNKGFLVMDKPYKEGEPFEGKAYVRGQVGVSGYLDNLVMEADLTTLQGSDIGVLAEDNVEEKENEFLVFVDSTGSVIADTVKLDRSVDFGLEMIFTFHVGKSTNFRLVFDKANSDVIYVNGTGDPIRLHIKRNGEMDLYGEYVIEKGNYPFSFAALGIPVIIPLGIEKGSKVAFNGDPFNPYLDVTATRTVKTDFKPLLLTQGVVVSEDEIRSTRRKKVVASVTLQGTFSNMTPQLAITSDEANSDEKEALDRLNGNQSDLEQEFFHLMALQSFSPSGKGSELSSADIAANVVNELISRGLSGEKVNVDFGLGSGESGIPDQVELGLDFNAGDRIQVSTSLGSSFEGETQAIIDVVVEYRIDDDGNMSITVFNKSVEPGQQDNGGFPFIQGVGFKYEVSYYDWLQMYNDTRDKKEQGRSTIEDFAVEIEAEGDVLRDSGDLEGARKKYDQAIELLPDGETKDDLKDKIRSLDNPEGPGTGGDDSNRPDALRPKEAKPEEETK